MVVDLVGVVKVEGWVAAEKVLVDLEKVAVEEMVLVKPDTVEVVVKVLVI